MNISFIFKRVALILVCLISENFLYAQYIEITIKDAKTDEVIPSVYVMSYKHNEKFETISNPEGKVKLPVNCDSIITSHVAYESLHIGGNQSAKNVLYLIPQTTELASITIYGTDLKKKMEYVLKKFSRFYINNERTYHCTYKEAFKVNDSLVRLLQVNMKWWDKEYSTDLRANYESQNQAAIDAVSYSKAINGKTIYSGALSNKSLFAALHLNNYLTSLLWQTQDFTIDAIEKTNISTKIWFDAVVVGQNGRLIGNLRNSYFIFDNKTSAMLGLFTQLVYNDRSEQVMSKKENIPVVIKYVSETRTMSFIKDKNKLRLSYFEFVGEHEDKVEDSIYFSQNKLAMYIVGSERGNTIATTSKIPLEEKSIYEQIQNTPKKDPSIILTSEELKFIKGNDNN